MLASPVIDDEAVAVLFHAEAASLLCAETPEARRLLLLSLRDRTEIITDHARFIDIREPRNLMLFLSGATDFGISIPPVRKTTSFTSSPPTLQKCVPSTASSMPHRLNCNVSCCPRSGSGKTARRPATRWSIWRSRMRRCNGCITRSRKVISRSCSIRSSTT